ncbi:MAG: enoyl-CoA hydratase/isomerase family protein [Burkholderiaceae bacterium]
MNARRPQLRLTHHGAVASIALARTRAREARVPDLLLDLCVALEEIGRRAETRAIVLAADGEAFAIGSDLRRLTHETSGEALETYSAEFVGLLNQAILALLKSPQPVVAAVKGAVTGGAIGLVLASDVVIAGDSAVFRAQSVAAGLTPDGGWTALLPRLVGGRRAAACLLLDRAVPAADALMWGLVTEVVPDAQVEQAARDAAGRIAAAPVNAIREGKRLLAADLDQVERALEAERRSFVAAIGQAETRAHVARFLQASDS